jgi:hypothetical protein
MPRSAPPPPAAGPPTLARTRRKSGNATAHIAGPVPDVAFECGHIAIGNVERRARRVRDVESEHRTRLVTRRIDAH